MDSLLANYGSSDEEEERKPVVEGFAGKLPKPSTSSSSSSSLFSALPQPRNPKTSIEEDGGLDSSSGKRKGKPSPFFSSLPPPKSLNSHQSGSASLDPVPAPPKRVVQIRLPVNPRPSNLDDDEDEEDEEEKERKKRRQMGSAASHDSSVKSFLSTMPAPRSSATLGVLPSSGSGRRSIIETEAPLMAESGSDPKASSHENYQSFSYNNDTNYADYGSGVDQSAHTSGVDNYYGGYAGYDPNVSGNGDTFGYDPNVSGSGDASGYVGYDGSYGGNAGYGDQYGNTWASGSAIDATTGLPEAVGAIDSAVKRARRGKKDMPPQIVEVKQDELMKNRPREDQVKMTGIAFGPAYQPASSKGKPSKLHKRKHQITSLYFDMKQKEMELAERRSRGLLTKSETQAKYGW